jgi:restriction endonuclease S subunit
MSFILGKNVDSEKVFIEQKINLNSRWDPFYVVPEVVALEKRVRTASPLLLRHFVRSMAGGATPSKKEADIHYTDANQGVPFIRVQNLSVTGQLNLEDCNYITRSTHDGLLKRSKLTGGELLVKITGVGRMAIASVVPENFEANINQHIVAIRTGNIKTSETLAAYLNLDIAEMLAKRRSTGGTRPALDYPALLSIPIIFDERISILMAAAVKLYQNNIENSKCLLQGIDNILLNELGIINEPNVQSTISSRIFTKYFSAVSGRRIDPKANLKQLKFETRRFQLKRLFDLVEINPVTRFPIADNNTLVSFVPMNAVSDIFGEIVDSHIRPIGQSSSYTRFQNGDIIWAKITPCMENGKSAVARNLINGFGFGSTEFHVFRCKTTELCPDYLHHLLRLQIVRHHARLNFTGCSGHQRVDEDFFYRLEIPFPPRPIQEQIVHKIEAIKTKSNALFADAQKDLERAKREIEALILDKQVEQ